ncbi:MAG: sel1 repeat family protein [Ruminiclostridium sp.]|nr:sel1 repeat family protein [Ruminiclostridium sp.]
MTIKDAQNIRERFVYQDNLSEEDVFLYSEAMQYLIEQTKNSEYMLELGGVYYERKDFDLALKYYEMSASFGNEEANICLGYIWYYGRTGTVDYKKAFEYYSGAPHHINALYKVADMYKNGYYVEKNYDKYKEIIEDIYAHKINQEKYYIPEIYTRLAKIRSKEGKTDEAIKLYREARIQLAFRIYHNAFFGNVNIMKWLIEDLYKLTEIDMDNIDLFDLFELLKKPIKIKFFCDSDESEHIVEAVDENGEIVIDFDGKWYRTTDDLFGKAEIAGDRLVTLGYSVHDFEVI